MSLDGILGSIATGLKTHVPSLKTSVVAGGRFNLEEMQRHSAVFPAAFITLASTADAGPQPIPTSTRGRFVAVLAVSARAAGQLEPTDRPRQIARLVGRVLYALAIKAKDWGNNEVLAAPTNIDSSNLYSKTADAHNVALWAVTWEQDLLLKEDPAPGELDDFNELAADYQLVESQPPIDAQDIIKPNG